MSSKKKEEPKDAFEEIKSRLSKYKILAPVVGGLAVKPVVNVGKKLVLRPLHDVLQDHLDESGKILTIGGKTILTRDMSKTLKDMREKYPNLKDVKVKSSHVAKGPYRGSPGLYTHDKPSPGASEFLKMLGLKPGTVYVASKNVPIMAHEFGHASMDKLKKIRLTKAILPGIILSSVGGTLALGDEETRDYAPAIVLAGQSPLLLEESRATLRALRSLGRTGGKKGVVKGLRSLLPAFATYATVAGSATGASYLSNALNKKIDAVEHTTHEKLSK